MRTCADCGKKNVPNASRSKRCEPCRKARHAKQLRDYRADGRHRRAYTAWRAKDPKRTWLMEAWGRVKARCDRTGFPFERHELETPDQCPVLGVVLDYGKKGKTLPNSPSLDKIDPSKGYVPGNVAVISMRANLIKSDASEAELKKVLRYVRIGLRRRSKISSTSTAKRGQGRCRQPQN